MAIKCRPYGHECKHCGRTLHSALPKYGFYCNDKCLNKHLVIVRKGAAARIEAYLAKKGK